MPTKSEINGLSQLDPGEDPLTLVAVRTDAAEPEAPGAINAPQLIADLRVLLKGDPEAAAALQIALGNLGWYDHASHEALALQLIAYEEHPVGSAFPRLTAATVPPGVVDVDYAIVLPDLAVDHTGDIA